MCLHMVIPVIGIPLLDHPYVRLPYPEHVLNLYYGCFHLESAKNSSNQPKLPGDFQQQSKKRKSTYQIRLLADQLYLLHEVSRLVAYLAGN